MNDSAEPSSDAAAVSEKDDGRTKSRTAIDDESTGRTAAPTPGPAGDSTTTMLEPECRGQRASMRGTPVIRAATSYPPPPPQQPPPPGCGCVAAAVDKDEITVNITPTTGGQFELTVDRNDTVENLKKIISKRLKVVKERICLLHRERQLREGTLEENGLQHGSRLTLLPSVETGLLAQRPEQSVMQALESLNDSQVNDFLSGKAPLNLTMRLGDHMMLIQLQLSTVTPASPTAANQTASSPGGNSNQSNVSGLSNSSGNSSHVSNLAGSHVTSSLQTRRCPALTRSSSSSGVKLQSNGVPARTSHLINSLANALHAAANCGTSLSTATTTTTTTSSPVCSGRTTSAVVSQTTTSSCNNNNNSNNNNAQSQSSRGNHVSPTSNGSTGGNGSSCLPCPLYHHHHHTNHHHRLHHHHYHHHHHHSRDKQPGIRYYSTTFSSATTASSSSANSSSCSSNHPIQDQSTSNSHGCVDLTTYDTTSRKKLCTGLQQQQQQSNGMDATRSHGVVMTDNAESRDPQSPTCTSLMEQPAKPATLDTRALAEASRNLTQKLKQLSSEENARRRQGAIIESMHHHGKGVYSGTFSGTLNPALQDRHGRPKRDISTIIHILNDLLCATPAASAGHYRHHHHRHSHSRQQSSSVSTSSTGTSTTASGSTTSVGCHDSTTPGYSTEELSKENEATKGKMRRLRLVMEQRRAKRKARRQARAAPYTTQWAAVTPADPNHEPNTSTAGTGTTSTNSAEPQNEPELPPCSPEPVVA
ncbi:PREDICTED: midnolin-A isoform X2 [Dinoponera quadriceps]|uniref:Midnolin-A isoform X2 n=1 Tax=Dinoponera quadriceps TaxID=609295 RepID=A0A6P3X8W7_DINQU|nr:PREDICTED: midnolin-A isoform X2 [Dinoponera quadriceps]